VRRYEPMMALSGGTGHPVGGGIVGLGASGQWAAEQAAAVS
jgi:hypothetical protein